MGDACDMLNDAAKWNLPKPAAALGRVPSKGECETILRKVPRDVWAAAARGRIDVNDGSAEANRSVQISYHYCGDQLTVRGSVLSRLLLGGFEISGAPVPSPDPCRTTP